MATEGTAEAVKTGSKCMEWIKKLVKAFKRAQDLFHRISGIFNRVKDVLRRGAERLPGPLRRVGGMLEPKDAKSFADKVREGRPDRRTWSQVVSSEHSIGENLRDAGRAFADDARREFGEKFGEELGGELKRAAKKETAKEVLKHLGEGLDGDDDDESPEKETAARQPLFDNQGARRISGSIE
jgi:hypothetical protein